MLTRRICVVLFALVAWGAVTASATAGTLPPAGIYQVWGKDSGATAPYVRGGQITLDWATIEPKRRTFNWSSLDSELKYYASIGKVATVQVNSTQTKPSWLWNVVANCGTVHGQPAPQYWDPVYETVQTELVSALAAHLKASPYLAQVALVRAAPNAIGTELTDMPAGYTCKATPSGHKVSTVWSKTVADQYYYDVMNLYRVQMLPEVQVALRAQVWTQWPGHCPTTWLGPGGAWIMGTASDVDPNPVRDAFDLYAYDNVKLGSTNAYWEPISYAGKKNLVSWNWWRILLELDKGVRSIAVYGDVLAQGQANPEFRAVFDFANRYAGHQWDPAGSPGAWVALREGSGRMAGDFTWFMTQLNPNTTSTPVDSNAGASMIGPAAQRYGRYARRITGGTAQSTMSFALDPAFRSGIAAAQTTLHVTYLDNGTGSFQMAWGNGPDQAVTVTKTNTGAWQTADIPVPGLEFTGGLAGGADLAISELGSDATNFAMVELTVDGR
ncbi:MAG TPA: hypothetical protein VE824_06860 [Gaiellales bacterium]|nr:hypothetical protein [Gaiellales bacterium]